MSLGNEIFCNEDGCLRKVFSPHIYCDKHVDNSSKPTMSSLDDKLRKILLVQPAERRANAIELTVAQIKQVFADEGYQPIATPVLGSEDNINFYYFDRTDKAWKVRPDNVMTGQEWFEAFMAELLQIQENRKLPMRAHHFVEAAKKASGVKK